MPQFKTIRYPWMLVDTLRAYHTVNAAGQLSFMYKFCLCCIYPLQAVFNAFHIWRIHTWLVAGCKWQIGQLQNVLNMIYDSTLNRIVVVQATNDYVLAPNIDDSAYPTANYIQAPNIDDSAYPTANYIQAPNIDDATGGSGLTILVPYNIYDAPVTMSALTSDIESIRLKGIRYTIKEL